MSANFTPLPTPTAQGKGAVNVNTVLIIIALVITVLLGALMWFLVVQKQQEENKANIPTKTAPNKTVEATVEQSDVADQQSVTPTSSPSVAPSTKPTPLASPSAVINP